MLLLDRILNTEVNGHCILYSQDTLAELMINILSDGKLKKVSSNNTTSNSLSNGSSKTREFHDEPFGKSYSITVTYDKVIKIFVAFIHIDNQLTLE